jgi:hypothetical protein
MVMKGMLMNCAVGPVAAIDNLNIMMGVYLSGISGAKWRC